MESSMRPANLIGPSTPHARATSDHEACRLTLSRFGQRFGLRRRVRQRLRGPLPPAERPFPSLVSKVRIRSLEGFTILIEPLDTTVRAAA